ncbi:MAG: MBL fold metallo-hydrolase [Butyrivibrio sp.]|nr:MBL fold metallo-hydrolase [Butyrivibrio sp.]
MRRKRVVRFVGFVVVIIAVFVCAKAFKGKIKPRTDSVPLNSMTQQVTTNVTSAAESVGDLISSEISEVDAASDESSVSSIPTNEDTPCDDVYVDYIDVGQGDATLIYDETSDYSVLIDTGLWEAYDNVQATFAEYGIMEVDALVLTHPDTDHIQSAVDVIKDYNVPVVYMSRAQNNEAKAYEYLMGYLEEQYSGDIRYPVPGEELLLGQGCKLAFLGPVRVNNPDDTNGNSLVMKLENGLDSFLFVGDATGDEIDDVISSGQDVSADVYKASHHGSANDGCNSYDFIRQVDPKYMVISCGYLNEHGHPHKETMAIASQMNLKLYRTDLQGSICCLSRGNGLVWQQEPSTVYTNGNGF